jgi:phospholipase C
VWVPSSLARIEHVVVLMLSGFDRGVERDDALQAARSPSSRLALEAGRAPAAPPDPVMGCHDESHVRAYEHLTRSFTACERWFSSVPGPALPNRLFSLAGSSGGDLDDASGLKFYEGLRSVFDCLDHALAARPEDERWGYYFHDLPVLALLKQHLDEISPALPGRLLRWLTGRAPRVRKLDAFFERARRGRLPAVSWIDPEFVGAGGGEGDHSPGSGVHDGQRLVAEVYDAILGGRSDLWATTLLVVLCDEHGGFSDQVSPPSSGDPPPFDRLGARVPAVVVSAWTPAGVDRVVRDHTCLLRTILDRFAPAELLTPRVARAASLAALLSLPAPRRDVAPIEMPRRPTGVAAPAAPATAPSELARVVRRYRAELTRRGAALE